MRNYIHNLLITHTHNMSKTCKVVNSIIGWTNDNKSTIDLLTNNNEKLRGHKEVADKCCDYFTNVGKRQAEQIETSKTLASDYLTHIPMTNSICFSHCDEIEIISIIVKT